MENLGLLIGLAYLGAIGVFFVYVRQLQVLLRRCMPSNRRLKPGLVWLQVVPVFGALWQFIVVRALGRSLRDEVRSRGWPVSKGSHRWLGISKATVDALALAHVLGFYVVAVSLGRLSPTGGQVAFTYLFFASGVLQLGSIVLWGAFWERMSKFSSWLRATSALSTLSG